MRAAAYLRLAVVPSLLMMALAPSLAAQQQSQMEVAANLVHPITSLPKPTEQPAAQPAPTTDTAGPAIQPPAPVLVTPPPAPQPMAYQPPAPVTPDLGSLPMHAAVLPTTPAPVVQQPSVPRPFRSYGVQVKIGLAGIGVDVATPISRRMNVRVGSTFFNYNGNFNVNGMDIAGDGQFRSATLNLDIFPFHGGFRISPGVNFNNTTHLTANVSVPAGQTFSLGDDNYTSSTTDPVSGTASFALGKRVVPSFTIGWGNMVPRSHKHLSFPFEIGFQYVSAPSFALSLKGTACSSQGCSNMATDPTAQANIQQEIQDINSDIYPLRFFPILSQGVSWKF